jgi:hypothetical protein
MQMSSEQSSKYLDIEFKRDVLPKISYLVYGYLIFDCSPIFISKKDPFDSLYLVLAQIPSSLMVFIFKKKEVKYGPIFQYFGQFIYLVVTLSGAEFGFIGGFLIPFYMIPAITIFSVLYFIKRDTILLNEGEFKIMK